jgi:hypothetical protein
MRGSGRWIVVVPMLAGLQVSGCHGKSHGSAHAAPAHVEKIEGTDLKKVTLTAKAAERLGIETSSVNAYVTQGGAIATAGDSGGATLQGDPRTRAMRSATAGSRTVVPYAAVLYDSNGDAWVYTNPEPLVFVRHRIKIDYISGDRAVLSEGPAVGTAVVTLGAAELFGTEFEVGH